MAISLVELKLLKNKFADFFEIPDQTELNIFVAYLLPMQIIPNCFKKQDETFGIADANAFHQITKYGVNILFN